MKRIFPILLTSLFTLVGGIAFAQPCSVHISATDSLVCLGDSVTLTANLIGPETTMDASSSAGNNHRGNMFDIVATNSVTITSFDASPMGNTTIAIYYKVGTWNGFANTPSAWTYIGSAPVTYQAGFSPVAVPVNVTIPAGQTYAFYVTSNTSAVSLNYSDGTAVGNVYTSDANISFLEGGGMEYPFTAGTGGVFQPRVWNGRIHYALADQPTATYTWSTTESTASIEKEMTAATQYTVESTVTGCPTMNDTLDINVSIPVVTAHGAQSVCSGDSVMVFGTGAESYNWDNGVTDSVTFEAVGTQEYFVTGIDSIGCVDTDSVTITVFELPAVDAGTNFGVCQGDSAVLSAQGAVDYSWDNGINDGESFLPAMTGTYHVTGTDTNGCIGTDSIVVTVNPLPVVSAGPDLDLCQGVEYSFYGSGAATYDWDNGVVDGEPFVAQNATYTVIGTDANGCVDSDEMTVTLHNIMASIYASGTTLTAGTLVDMSVQWVNCSDMSAIAGETDVIYVPEVTGSYAVVIEDNVYGCIDTSNCVIVDFTGIDENAAAELSVYPVPTNGKITVLSTGAAIERVELIDLLGNVLQSAEPNAAQTEIDLSAYAANTFFVRVFRNDRTELLKVMKQ